MRGIPSIGLLDYADWIRSSLSLTWTGEKEEITKSLSLVTTPESAPIPSAKGVAKSLLASKAIGYISEKKAFPDLLCVDFTSIIDGESISGILLYEKNDVEAENMVSYDYVACFSFLKYYSLISHAQISKSHYVVRIRNSNSVENKQPETSEINFFLKNADDDSRTILIWTDPVKGLTLTIKNQKHEVKIGPIDLNDLEEPKVEEPVVEPPPADDTVIEPSLPEAIEEPDNREAESIVVDRHASPEVMMPSLLNDWTVDQLRMLRDAIGRKITYLETEDIIARVNASPLKTISMLQHFQTLLELRNLSNPPLKLIENEVEILRAMLG